MLTEFKVCADKHIYWMLLFLVLLLPILLYLYFGCCLQSSAGQFALGRNHIKSTSPPPPPRLYWDIFERAIRYHNTHPPTHILYPTSRRAWNQGNWKQWSEVYQTWIRTFLPGIMIICIECNAIYQHCARKRCILIWRECHFKPWKSGTWNGD